MISWVRTLRGFFAAGISSGALLALLPVAVEAQEARYLRCESPEDVEFYADIRTDLPESFVEDWVGWNAGCRWIIDPAEYDDWWEVEEGVTCFTPPFDPDPPDDFDPLVEGTGYYGCALTEEWKAAR